MIDSPFVSIVIVNYNSGDYLNRCLQSVKEQTFTNFEVIIVDNASNDDSLKNLNKDNPNHVIYNSENLGFAAAQNQGMKLGCGKYLMSLNFDIHLTPDFLKYSITALEKHPQAGTISGKLLKMQPDGTFTDIIDNAGLLMNRRRMPYHRGAGECDSGQYQKHDLVFGAMGAAAVYRRTMLEDIAYQGQFFDESFFTWYEDVDLDWRGRLYGWDCLYISDAVAYHVGDPQKNKPTMFATRHTIRNRWQMILANECSQCMLRDLRWLFVEEFNLLNYVVRSRRFPAYAKAIAELIQRLPSVLAKRRWVQSQIQLACLPDYPQTFQ